ncbi:TetR/AcrR family transcriptional regulator [Pseudoprimorskyibacter insulae]|uniref:HTH-type transcriptional repressor NicS n=1 Tax=Pseudoprimorskyibacter insulae TaxID=1695997 RepID=A0A2R8AZD2_9RHOB|nr:TetR/AcrR family transcriptional regulator [Pseudoprimorskyibacter insulae]SPF81327.1 HTH-type transcriptional repressor NicS [Pseudoprimorskyibacter insulae]
MARTIASDHDQKREQILKSAAKIFSIEGFDRASMTMLAKECGISKANIYHYYTSKDAILFDILETYLRMLRDRVCELDLTGADPAERLRRVIHEILQAYRGADHEHRVQINGVSKLPPDQQRILRTYQRDMVVFVSDIIRDTAPDVLGKDGEKLRSVTMSVFGMLNWYYMWNTGAGPEAREDYARLVSDMTLKGVQGV